MTTFKSTILLLLISASVISGTTKTRTARGIFGSIFSGLGGGKGSGGALIVLHGLGGGTGGPICKLMDVGLPLDSSVKIVCPQAEWTSNTLLPPTWLYALVGIGPRIKSWYSMNMMPGMSTLSPIPGESKAGLEDAMKRVEGVIQKLVNQGIPSEKIVLSGLSQGGSLTLYTALHTKYKLGGFIGIVAWLPLLKVEPPTGFTPVNANTPILHINGGLDPIVPVNAGSATSRELAKVIPDYTYKLSYLTTHTTSLNPVSLQWITKWLQSKHLLKLSTIGRAINFIPSFPIGK